MRHRVAKWQDRVEPEEYPVALEQEAVAGSRDRDGLEWVPVGRKRDPVGRGTVPPDKEWTPNGGNSGCERAESAGGRVRPRCGRWGVESRFLALAPWGDTG